MQIAILRKSYVQAVGHITLVGHTQRTTSIQEVTRDLNIHVTLYVFLAQAIRDTQAKHAFCLSSSIL